MKQNKIARKMKLAVLFSGGKDSCLALHKVLGEGKKVDCLLSMIPEHSDSWMFHKPDFRLLKKQAENLGIKLITGKTKAKKEEELEDLKKLIKKAKVDGIVIGGIASNYQGKRIKKICDNLGLRFYAPLWDYDTERLWKELLDVGFKVILTKIACEGISRDWLGKIIDRKNFEELKKLSGKYKFDLTGEGGDFETAVLFMPGMEKEIKLKYEITSEGSFRHFMRIKKIL